MLALEDKIQAKKKKGKERNIDLAVVRERGSLAVCNTFLYTKFNTNNNLSWRKKKKEKKKGTAKAIAHGHFVKTSRGKH